MRKQVEQAAGAIMLTAQEAPETNRRMREDLYKKTMSADGIAGRRPYGMSTRMIELVGWKRCEVNRIMRFMGVTEANFPSILRRSLVWKPMARFINEHVIRNSYPDAHLDGYFCRDDSLKEFLRSGPCIAAALQIQHAFETLYSAAECLDLIEAYANKPLTEDLMREACGLAPKKRSEIINDDLLQIPVDTTSQELMKEKLVLLKNVANAVRDFCLSKGKGVFTAGMFKYLKLPLEHPADMSREDMWKALLSEGFLLQAGEDHAQLKDAVLPAIKLDKKLFDVFPELEVLPADTVHNEMHDKHSLMNYISSCPDRESNVCTVLSYLEAGLKKLKKRGRGKAPPEISEKIKETEERLRKLQATEKTFSDLAHNDLSDAAQSADGASQKKIRLSSKTSLVPATRCIYNRNFQDMLRTRAYLQGFGAQSCSRKMLRFLCPATRDLDIENSVFTLLHQLLLKLGAKEELPEYIWEPLEQCAEARDDVCLSKLKTSVKLGKKMLHEVLFGGCIPTSHSNNGFLLNFQRTARCLRWLACSLLPQVFERVRSMEEKRNPQASALFYLYAAVEDWVLEAWEDYMSTITHNHLSLHFDGLRVGGLEEAQSIEDLCKKSEAAILDTTGFKVKILEKRHLYFRELCNGVSDREETEVEQQLLQPGNCIPLAVSRLLPTKKQAVISELCKSSQQNTEALRVGSRSYADVIAFASLHVCPSLGLDVQEPGLYLLHSEDQGRPHCVSCKVQDDGNVELSDGKFVMKMKREELRKFADDAIDGASLVTFKLFDKKRKVAEREVANNDSSILLQLHAGANVVDGDWAEGMADHCEYAGPDDDSADECHAAGPYEEDEDEEPMVTVGDILLASMKNEVASVMQRNRERRCPLCPFRVFNRPARLSDHIRVYHAERRQCVCSGTKQLKIVCALFDSDQIASRTSSCYIARSAEILRETVSPPLTDNTNAIDRSIRLVFSGAGPQFWNKATVDGSSTLRRVRNIYYTVDFADVVYRELLLCNAKCKAAIPRILVSMMAAGCELASLMPRHVKDWWPIIEDIFSSPALRTLQNDAMTFFLQKREFQYLSIDGTMKCTLPVLGQAPWRAAKAVRDEAPFDDESALRKVLTVRGCSSAVLAMIPVSSEKAEVVCAALSDRLPLQGLNQTQCVASDSASLKLYTLLRRIMPNLKCLCLDPIHLPIVYESLGRSETV